MVSPSVEARLESSGDTWKLTLLYVLSGLDLLGELGKDSQELREGMGGMSGDRLLGQSLDVCPRQMWHEQQNISDPDPFHRIVQSSGLQEVTSDLKSLTSETPVKTPS